MRNSWGKSSVQLGERWQWSILFPTIYGIIIVFSLIFPSFLFVLMAFYITWLPRRGFSHKFIGFIFSFFFGFIWRYWELFSTSRDFTHLDMNEIFYS